MNIFERTELLIGKEALKKLSKSTVGIFGIGGVGSFAAEALGRCGVGNLVLVDYDRISESNINRQIHATTKTIGKYKVDVMKERLLDINPNINVITFNEKYNEETSERLLALDYDYIIDAIDMVSSKINLIRKAVEKDIPIISSMGAGNKLDPTKFEVTDIYKTEMCPLAKVLRYELKKHGVKRLKVVYSKEKPKKTNMKMPDNPGKNIPGSISFVPPVAGFILASVVVNDLINNEVK
ncbi:MAG TPA: tRNA threonylcarbamoyladenosine dehydratase [Clostridiales bacterium]|nr:tRNA threonylcarbamoyladenosine dehydratase [Clostridiales bacterium]